MKDKILQVFIAATFIDLKDFRQVAMEAILRIGLIPVTFENLPSTTKNIQDAVKKMIEASDIVIFIVGHRYGATFGELKTSWTEFEFEYAKQLKKPILAFLTAEDIPLPVSKIDIQRNRIEYFRNRIESEYFVARFSSPSELGSSIVQGLTHLISRTISPVNEIEKKKKVREVRIIKLLLSSPGDVAEERARVSLAVFRYNQELVEEKGLFIKLIRWEDMAPQIGPRPQEVINKQIGKYHLFVGIMWNRFGNPTDIAASGTKEEFDSAVTLWKKFQKPWITFYFCERPVNFKTPEQLEQKQKVLSFRAELNDMGIVRTYVTPEEFEEKVYSDLIRITALPEFNNKM